MKLLVAGSRGQVARALAEAAADFDVDLAALGRPALDLTDPDSIEKAIEKAAPDWVINAAAYTAVDQAEEDREAVVAVNHHGAGALAAICGGRNIPLVHLSTDYVFDGSRKTPYTETDAVAPLGVYGRSKRDGEIAVIAGNPRHLILRTAWVYSPFGQNFVKTMLRLAETRDELNVVDDQRGCPTYAPHIARGILRIIAKLASGKGEKPPWGIYNMAGGGETSWCGFAREIFIQSEKLGGATARVHPITTWEYPTPARRPANSRLDCSKLAQVFGVTLPDWRDGTAACVARLAGDREIQAK